MKSAYKIGDRIGLESSTLDAVITKIQDRGCSTMCIYYRREDGLESKMCEKNARPPKEINPIDYEMD